jgi:drug/metabolite transporter (DMT)-like permease
VAAFAAVYVLWGCNFLAIRYAVEAIPPFLMMGLRSLLAGAVLFVGGGLGRGRWPRARHWRNALLVGGLFFVGCHGLLAWAEQHVSSGIAALVLATIPMWMLLLEWLAGGERPRPGVALGMALGFAGVMMLVGAGPAAGGRAFSPLGMAGLGVSAFMWAAGSVVSRRVELPQALGVTAGMQLLCGGALLVALASALGEWGRLGAPAFTARPLLSMAYMVIASSLLGFTAFAWLLRHTTAARAGSYAFVNPVVAVLVGWAVGGEPLQPRTLVAGAAVVAGVALVVLGGRPVRG